MPTPTKDTGHGERAFLAALRRTAWRSAPSTLGALRLGIGDDCAVLRPPNSHDVVVTTDLFLEQVHFRRDWHQPEMAGHRCLARGLSDIAAMGARPLAAFLSLALPRELAGKWVERFLEGLLRLAKSHGVPLAGGDTAAAPLLHTGGRSGAGALFSADIVLLGSVPPNKALLRSGACLGDAIYVTGALGGAAAELANLGAQPQKFAHLVRSRGGHPHLFPEPRLVAGQYLLRRASSAIDLSDGLSTDLAHLCEESGVAACIDASALPLHRLALNSVSGRLKTPDARREAALPLALHGGEDYELLFTASPGRRIPPYIAGVAVTRIGTIVKPHRAKPLIQILYTDGMPRPLENSGWQHFKDQ